jgi:hypothetical protein
MITFLKFRCVGCGLVHLQSERPSAPSPFDPQDILTCCPECKDTADPDHLCQEQGCVEMAGCGTPFGMSGYKFHCRNHPPSARDLQTEKDLSNEQNPSGL